MTCQALKIGQDMVTLPVELIEVDLENSDISYVPFLQTFLCFVEFIHFPDFSRQLYANDIEMNTFNN